MRASRLLLGFLFLTLLGGGLWFAMNLSEETPQAAGLARDEPLARGQLDAQGGELASAVLDGGSPGSASARSASEVKTPEATQERVPRPAHKVRGRVVDEFGSPVADARVVYASNSGMPGLRIDELAAGGVGWLEVDETRSDSGGRFEFDFARRGTVRLALRSPGFAPLRVSRELAAQGETLLEDLVLEQSVVLAGHVVDTSGVGIAGAGLHDITNSGNGFGLTIFARGSRPLAVTDEAGAFTIEELPAGPFRLRVEHEAHPSTLASGHIARAGENQTGERYVLEDGFEISGRLLGLDAGQEKGLRVRGLRVDGDFDEAFSGMGGARTADVDAGGYFVLRGLRAGRTYRVSAVEAGGDGANAFFSDSRSSVAIATAGDSGVELELRDPAALIFQVVDAQSGEPLTELEVEAGSPWTESLRDDDGNQLKSFPDGLVRYDDVPMRAGETHVSLRVRASGYETWNQAGIALPAGRDTDLGVLKLERVPTITVRVFDATSEQPLQGARVTLRAAREAQAGRRTMSFAIGGPVGEEQLEAPMSIFNDDSSQGRTDEHGLVELASLPGQRAELFVRHKQYAEHTSDPISLPATGSAEYEVGLTQGGTVIVKVLDSQGAPLEGARVTHRSPSDEPNMIFLGGGGGRKTRSDGTLAFRNLAPGSHHFELAEDVNPGFGSTEIVIEGLAPEESGPAAGVDVLVVEGVELEVLLHAKPRGSLFGKVTEGGDSLAGATISFTVKSDSPTERPSLPGFGGMGGDKSAKSDSKGEYSLPDIKVGEYTARISHPTRAMATTFSVSVAEGRQTCDFPLSVTILEGRVVDSKGQGLAGVEVKPKRAVASDGPQVMLQSMLVMDGGSTALSFGPGGSPVPGAMTDADGNYSLRGVAPEVELYVETSSSKYQDAKSETVMVGDGQTLGGVDVEVYEAGSIELRVLDGAGDPASFCMVRGVYQGDSDEPVDDLREFVGEGGVSHAGSLRPGTWRLTAQGMGNPGPGGRNGGPQAESEALVVEVRPGETATATLVLP